MPDILLQPLGQFSDGVLLAVRVLVGVVFIYYGWPKIRDLKSNAEDFVKMGFKPGWFWGTVVAVVETVGGLMVLFGVFAPVAAALLAGHMATGTVWKITKTDKSFSDWSYDLLLLALALVILAFGAGAYAVVG